MQQHQALARLDSDSDRFPSAAELLGRVRPADHLDYRPYRTPRGDVLHNVPDGITLRRLDLNEGPPAPDDLRAEWLGRLTDDPLHVYPDEHAWELRTVIAKHVGVANDLGLGDPDDAPHHIAVGSGSVQLYQQVPMTFRDTGDRARDTALVFNPAYGAYYPVIRSTGMQVLRHRFDGPRLDLEAMPGIAQASGAGLVILCSPNNPTGEVIPNPVIAEICAATDGVVMVDEAYGEFGSAGAVALLPRFPNLIVTGTTSKAFSLAWLRVGWAVANPMIIDAISRTQTPWHLSGPAQLAATLALDPSLPFSGQVAASVTAVRAERDRLARRLRTIPGVENVLGSQGNFVSFCTSFPAGDVWGALLATHHIQIRDIAAVMGHPRYLRVSVTNNPADTDSFLTAIREVLT
jgi:histidinol-phosphate aminotransferase